MDPTRERKAVVAEEEAVVKAVVPQQDQQELAALVAEMRAFYEAFNAPKGAARWFGKILKNLESNPKVQIAIHKWATLFWAINGVVATGVYILAPGLWNKLSILYLTVVSLYANLATDYDGLSSAQAHLHSLETAEAAKLTKEIL